jgi:hypothetical protein
MELMDSQATLVVSQAMTIDLQALALLTVTPAQTLQAHKQQG